MFYFQKISAPSRDDGQERVPTTETKVVAASPGRRKNYARYYVVAGCIAFAGLIAFIAVDIIFFGTVHQNTATEWTNQKFADKDVQRHLITAIPRWIGRLLSRH